MRPVYGMAHPPRTLHTNALNKIYCRVTSFGGNSRSIRTNRPNGSEVTSRHSASGYLQCLVVRCPFSVRPTNSETAQSVLEVSRHCQTSYCEAKRYAARYTLKSQLTQVKVGTLVTDNLREASRHPPVDRCNQMPSPPYHPPRGLRPAVSLLPGSF